MQDGFQYEVDGLRCEGVPLAAIAEAVGTPAYVYSQAVVLSRLQAYRAALHGVPHTICYAVKANSNLALLRVLAQAGAGFDIVSGGELYRVLRAGGEARCTVFSGVGKTRDEIAYALREGVHSLNCESWQELEAVNAVAGELGVQPSVSLRANPDVDASTHPYISTGLREHKFGIDIEAVEAAYEQARALPHLRLTGVSCHIGSQILETAPLQEAFQKMIALVDRLRERGFAIEHLDLGGGIGVPYQSEQQAPVVADVLGPVLPLIQQRGLHLFLEPGRSLVAEAGVLLTRVIYRKEQQGKHFIIVDAGMNDLIRPSLYKAHHEIVPVQGAQSPSLLADVVGPVCESGDFLAKDRMMPDMQPGELLAIRTAGAYGFVAASNYNARPRAAEVLVQGDTWQVARRRESYEDLVRGEE